MGLSALSPAHAEAPASARVEIAYLLRTIADSNCAFFRNGDWYDSKQAEQHLRLKYDALLARDLIGSAEDFIERGATYSSLSGRAYAVRCPGTAVAPAAQWLRELLARYRRSHQ